MVETKNKYMGEWDGTFKLAWTDNPAWILYDLMINPVYGCNRIDTREDINILNYIIWVGIVTQRCGRF